MVPARGWKVVRYKPLNELLRKTQRREVGGLHRGDVWAQDSVLLVRCREAKLGSENE